MCRNAIRIATMFALTLAFAVHAFAGVPKVVLVEDFTATW